MRQFNSNLSSKKAQKKIYEIKIGSVSISF
jgi:hypothetical protein